VRVISSESISRKCSQKFLLDGEFLMAQVVNCSDLGKTIDILDRIVEWVRQKESAPSWNHITRNIVLERSWHLHERRLYQTNNNFIAAIVAIERLTTALVSRRN